MKKSVLIFLAMQLAVSLEAHAASRLPAAAASATPEDPAFLQLPALDLEVVSNQASPRPDQAAMGGTFHVGDQIHLSTPSIEGALGPLNVEIPAGSSMSDQGWAISTVPHGNSLSLVIVPLKPGKLTLPSLAIKDGSSKSLARTNPWMATIESAIRSDDPEPQKPADLRPPAGLLFPWWVVAALSALGIALFFLLIFWLIRWNKKRKSKIPVVKEPPKTEDVIALEALAKLEKAQLVLKGDYKKYCFGISEILKAYIGARYKFDALECTTREMMRELNQSSNLEISLDKNRIALLGQLFDQLDLVKFTDQLPSQIEALQFLPTARDFVTETRRKIIAASSNPPENSLATPSSSGGGPR